MMEQTTIKTWPNDVEDLNKKKGEAVFVWKKLTINRTFPNDDSLGLRFAEDPEGKIWNLKGAWAEEPNPQTGKKYRLPYTGHKYQEGDVVNVQLVFRQYPYQGGTGEAREIKGITLVEQQDSSPAPGVHQATPVSSTETTELTYDQKAGYGQALNILVNLTCAGLTDSIGVTEEAAFAIIKEGLIRNLENKPQDLSTLLSLLNPTGNAEVVEEVVEELDW